MSESLLEAILTQLVEHFGPYEVMRVLVNNKAMQNQLLQEARWKFTQSWRYDNDKGTMHRDWYVEARSHGVIRAENDRRRPIG